MPARPRQRQPLAWSSRTRASSVSAFARSGRDSTALLCFLSSASGRRSTRWPDACGRCLISQHWLEGTRSSGRTPGSFAPPRRSLPATESMSSSPKARLPRASRRHAGERRRPFRAGPARARADRVRAGRRSREPRGRGRPLGARRRALPLLPRQARVGRGEDRGARGPDRGGTSLIGWLYDLMARRSEERELGARRHELLGGLAGEVLEIGAGTGASLPHYEHAARVVALEPDASMAKRLPAKAAAARAPVEVVEASAEAMPFPDESFDVVVSAFMLCSVVDPPAVLAEARRVLKPGGRLVLLEHVLAEGGIARWQERLTPLHRKLTGNCHLNRDTRAAPGAAVHVADDAVLELEPRGREDAVVEPAPVVDDDHDLAAPPQRSPRARKHRSDVFAVALDAAADLVRVPPFESQQLVGVRVLLVVVDEAWIRRRGQHEVDGSRRIELPSVAVQDGHRLRRAHVGELLHALDGVADVAFEELLRLADRPADATVLVAEVLLLDGLGREIEVVVTGEPCGARRAGEDHLPELGVLRSCDSLAKSGELGDRAVREPALQVGGAGRRLGGRLRSREADDVDQKRAGLVRGRLDPHQQAVEGGHVAAGRAGTEGVRLDKRRARPSERIPHEVPGPGMPAEEDFGELGHELSQVWMEAVHVLRPLTLGQLLLRPRELEVDFLVEGGLCLHRPSVRRFPARTFSRMISPAWPRPPRKLFATFRSSRACPTMISSCSPGR